MNRDYARALDAQLYALATSRRVAGRSEPLYAKFGKIQAAGLADAAPFFWSAETAKAVLAASRSVPRDTRLTKWNLPTASAWWYFEEKVFECVTLDYVTKAQEHVPVRALQLFWVGAVFVVVPWADSDRWPGEIYPCMFMQWPEGKTVTDMATSEQLNVSDGKMAKAEGVVNELVVPPFVLAALAWLEQKVATVSEESVHRARRREFAKATGRANVGVRVVQLRRAEARESAPTCLCGHPYADHDDGGRCAEPCACAAFEQAKVHWSCRWVVDGHWRHQPCGHLREERRLTWIDAYLKGPDGLPLKEGRKKLVAVIR
jgi:hypothetical protein